MKIKAKSLILMALVLVLTSAVFLGATTTSNAATVSYYGSASYRSGRYYAALTSVPVTGDQRTDIVNIGLSQVGYQEGNAGSLSGEIRGTSNYTEYGSWYGLQDMWCAMFVSWCANVAGVSSSVVPYHAFTPTGLTWFMNRGQAYSRAVIANGGYTPQPGDIIYFKSPRNSNITNHVGIVTGYSNGYIDTVEGNTSSATVSTNGGAVAAKTYHISNSYIVYICSPSYVSVPQYSSIYYPACSSSHTTLEGALASLGVDSSYENVYRIALANKMYNYQSNSQETADMLYLLKNGMLVKPLVGWAQHYDDWYYFDANHQRLTGFIDVEGARYYMDPATGKKLTGWQNVNGEWYYMDPNSGAMLTGFQTINGCIYYLGTDGARADDGWREIDGNTYYFFEGGNACTRWACFNDQMHYFNPDNGVMYRDAMVYIEGRWYYFDENGAMPTSCFIDYNGNTYYLNADGGAFTGWGWFNNSWYYFDYGTCAMYKNAKVYIDGRWYLFAEDGRRLEAQFYDFEGETYYLNVDGGAFTGWGWFNESWYYFDYNTCAMYKNAKVYIDGRWYIFGEDGKRLESVFCDFEGQTYYLNADGGAFTGWGWFNDSWYYFDYDTCAMYKTAKLYIDGRWYFFGEDGKMLTNQWIEWGGWMYYLNADGGAYTGWLWYNNNWYFFYQSANMARDCWVYDGGYTYFVDATGARVTGTHCIGGVYYTFNADGILIG